MATETYDPSRTRDPWIGTVPPFRTDRSAALERPHPVSSTPDPMYEIRTREDGALVGNRIELADGTWSRLKGLIGRTHLTDGEGLLISPCQAVHMYGVRFPVDVVFLNEALEVLAVYEGLQPGSRTSVHRHARYALKLPHGTLTKANIAEGQRLAMERVH